MSLLAKIGQIPVNADLSLGRPPLEADPLPLEADPLPLEAEPPVSRLPSPH